MIIVMNGKTDDADVEKVIQKLIIKKISLKKEPSFFFKNLQNLLVNYGVSYYHSKLSYSLPEFVDVTNRGIRSCEYVKSF